MSKNVKSNTSISASMAELFKAIEEIDKMIGVVRDISTKTDLLALNASIEAARAGHAGKGFAIVAHEVARLSEKAQESIGVVEAACGNLKRNIEILSVALKTRSEDAESKAA